MQPEVDDVMLAAKSAAVDASWPAIAKKVFIVVKSAFVIITTLQAAYKWRKTKLRMGIPA